MAEEIQQEEGAPKKKLPIMLILAVVGIVLLVVLTVVGTLAVTGFFSKPEQDSVEALLKKAEAEKAKAAEGDGHGGGGKDDGHGGKDGHGGGAKDGPNVKAAPGGPEKLQRGAPEATDSEVDKPIFRIELAEKVRLAMNAVLERYEGFGGIEQVLFTEFVVQ
ncbi:MAG: hypothetical protein EB068_02830 [Betaproteobacteria bacterium]|nr:hypothetical protein [Betaproteobacteria bacterium]